MSDAAEQVLSGLTPAPRFCRGCGDTLGADARCGCVAKASARAVDSPSPPRPGPTFRYALKMYFAMLALSAVAMAYVVAMGENDPVGARFDIGLSLAFVAVVVLWAAAHWRTLLPLLRPGGAIGWYAVAAAAPALTFLIASASIALLQQLLAAPAIDMALLFRAEGFAFSWLLLTACVVPAVFEEIAFRGVIFAGLRDHLTVAETVVVSSAIFAILHLSVLSIPHLLGIGLLLALLRVKTDSLLPGMLCHFLHNLLVCVTDWNEWRWPW
ncbi:MAG TPA: CPBP family intramembrane glutamic endopeptidase [Tepidisphaeraceae bacterium]